MTTTQQPTGMEAVEADPRTLIVGANVRLDARLDPALVASVRERGVLEPIVAYRDDEGALVVLMGQRRTRAAVEAERQSVPVVVVPRPAEDARLIDQMAENDHRSALTAGERVEAVAQLALLGMSAAAIAKQTATPRDDVAAALATAKSKRARAAIDTTPALTLQQAATLAEFEDDDEVTARLLDCAARGGWNFDHVAQRARDDRERRQAIEAARPEYEARGLTVIDAPGWAHPTAKDLRNLTTPEGEKIDPDQHAAECPGHAVYLTLTSAAHVAHDAHDAEDDEDDEYDTECTCDEDECICDLTDRGDEEQDGNHEDSETPAGDEGSPRIVAVPVCQDWKAHGHRYPYGYESTTTSTADMSEDERAAQARQRRETVANNKAADSAQVVRRAWLATLATRKTAPKGGPAVLAAVVTRWPEYVSEHKAREVLGEIFGVESYKAADHLGALIDKASDARATHLALVRILAAIEATTVRDAWRSPHPIRALYLTSLAAWGYDLAPVERLMAGLPPLDADEGEAAPEGQ